ncbi:intraflagellar transport protein 80-like protein [Anopheles sinensis]|uniref:Intraflagellar transport protein 80-like protein n=1 Tax=Anopheles sinensis TaxID=74873 RepID=A0A084WU51_ANOSI|nr:intraflagellar transport protein 80-like protein [Anopheles sinensis]
METGGRVVQDGRQAFLILANGDAALDVNGGSLAIRAINPLTSTAWKQPTAIINTIASSASANELIQAANEANYRRSIDRACDQQCISGRATLRLCSGTKRQKR